MPSRSPGLRIIFALFHLASGAFPHSLLVFIIIGLAVLVHGIVLQIYAIMAVHRLSGGKATLVVFLPAIVLLVLACLIVIIVVAIAAGLHH